MPLTNVKKKPREIPSNAHVFICGQTGSGKTKLAQVYLASYDNVIFLDPKRTFHIENLIPDIEVYEYLEELMEFGEGKAVYRPAFEEQEEETYNRFFEWIFKRHNTIVYIDELMSVCDNSQPPKFLKACLVMGREIGVGVWSSTQRPKTIPLVNISESQFFFVFHMNLETDRKRIMEVIPFKELENSPNTRTEPHNFWYYDYSLEKPIRASLQLEGGE